ncbi:MAG: hypothetical protein EWM73_03412 [Nitrospira sp.]|nr:MAG: hypothetical protein EWM73_03412 [Nitrospira sp.]
MGLDRRELTFKAEHAGRNERLFGEEAGVIHEKPRGKVVRSVQHDVERVYQRKNIVAVDILVIGLNRDLRVDRRQGFATRLYFWHADRGCGVKDLPLQVREIDDITIDQTDGADTGGSKIESGRRAKPTGADEQDFRLTQLHLALAAYVAEYNLTAVPLNLLFSEFHFLFRKA